MASVSLICGLGARFKWSACLLLVKFVDRITKTNRGEKFRRKTQSICYFILLLYKIKSVSFDMISISF